MGNVENDTKNCVVWFGAEKKGVNRVDPEQIVLLKKGGFDCKIRR